MWRDCSLGEEHDPSLKGLGLSESGLPLVPFFDLMFLSQRSPVSEILGLASETCEDVLDQR